MNDLMAGFQEHLEEVRKGRDSQEGAEVVTEEATGGGNRGGEDEQQETEAEEAEEEDEFKDAKETEYITSNTSKTQCAADDSQARIATSAVPHPQAGEGGHHVPAAVGHGDG